MYMVRKQLYISDEQEQLLKQRANELSTTEAEMTGAEEIIFSS